MPIIDTRNTWPVDRQEERVNKGKLVRVQRASGQFVKMYEADAIAQGLLPSKARPPAPNKMRLPEQNKADRPEPEDQPETLGPAHDDFTTIEGVGPATARALVVNGISTFEQLRNVKHLAFLTAKANEALEAWRGLSGAQDG